METYEFYKEKYGLGYIKLPHDIICEVNVSYVVFYKNHEDFECWHRLDGPAYIDCRGNTEWWINNGEITYPMQDWANDNNIDLENLTEVDKALIKIAWAGHDYGNI